ncbi:MAG: hypothetical protein ACJ79O_09905, partial [Myxococcales bacterium]
MQTLACLESARGGARLPVRALLSLVGFVAQGAGGRRPTAGRRVLRLDAAPAKLAARLDSRHKSHRSLVRWARACYRVG